MNVFLACTEGNAYSARPPLKRRSAEAGHCCGSRCPRAQELADGTWAESFDQDSLAESGGLGFPWPPSKVGPEGPMLGAETIGDHERGRTSTIKRRHVPVP